MSSTTTPGISSSPSSIPILPTRQPSPPGWNGSPSSAHSGSPRCAAASASPRPRSLHRMGITQGRVSAIEHAKHGTTELAYPGRLRRSPRRPPGDHRRLQQPQGSPSPNPAPKQPDHQHRTFGGPPSIREHASPASSRSGQPSMILTPGRLPARQARGSQKREPTCSDAPGPGATWPQNLLAGEGLPARLTPTVADTPKFDYDDYWRYHLAREHQRLNTPAQPKASTHSVPDPLTPNEPHPSAYRGQPCQEAPACAIGRIPARTLPMANDASLFPDLGHAGYALRAGLMAARALVVRRRGVNC